MPKKAKKLVPHYICYECNKIVKGTAFHVTHSDPLAQICDDCKRDKVEDAKQS